MTQLAAYSQAASTGKYERSTGLLGKYDNVRRFWEDQATGIFLRPFLNELVDRKRRRLERLRILDLGCGSGDGFDLIMSVTREEAGIYDYITAAITADMLKEYVGVEINEDLLRQAREYHGEGHKKRFLQADLAGGLPFAEADEPPFDIYLSSYGTLSHFTNEQLVRLVADICRHAPERALFIGDWLGRYSYEWQDLWHHPDGDEYFMDYRISYIYPAEERHVRKIDSFPLRLMTRDEILALIARAAREAGVSIRPLVFFDRSIFVGRHLETGDYNAQPLGLRGEVNSLFESYRRTDLENLLVDYLPRPGFEHLSNFFEMFFLACNTLVQHTIAMLRNFNCRAATLTEVPDIQPFYPEPLKEAIATMRRVVEGSGWLGWGDPRANIIEPHLGYSLRKLEMDLQPGTGVGHGLIGVFEINKE